MNPKIIYIFDPLCGWCYGFSPVIKKIHEEYKDKIDLDIISGGMMVGDRVGSVGAFADYILKALPRLEELTGVTFGESYLSQLKDRSLFLSSLKPCIALEVFKSFNEKEAIAFASSMQKAHYIDGKSLEEEAVYLELIEPYDIDSTEFLERLNSDEFKYETTNQFKMIQEWGITGFPAVILVKNEEFFLIAKGYVDFKNLQTTIEKILENNS
ncbi:DsbA family protein [soil metagenome]